MQSLLYPFQIILSGIIDLLYRLIVVRHSTNFDNYISKLNINTERLRMKHHLFFLFFLSTGFTSLYAQTFMMDSSTQITTCGGMLTDSGGDTGDYGADEDIEYTICSDGAGLSHIRLSFPGGVQISDGDILCFYDGLDTNAPLLACANEFGTNQTTIIQATAANQSGCLTLRFKSNSTDEAPGWIAEISCVSSCQQVQSTLVQTNPAIAPADTGWIDICPGESVFFEAAGIYPQNGLVYGQSDSTSSFSWSFGDGNTGVGPSVIHTFKEPGGYKVQVLITDTLGCTSTNFISQRVRVAPIPTFDTSQFPKEICVGDSLTLAAAIDDSSSFAAMLVFPSQASFAIEAIRADSTALPDGTGVSYETSISFDQFVPGQTLDDIADLEAICLTIEHSWLRDLEIKLTCPNGTSVVLHDHPNNLGDEVFLGAPIDDDDGNLIPGQGFEYCWTPDATNGTFLEYANTFDPDTLPPGNYSSVDSLHNLLGCPLNGQWTIEVTDLWLLDNGFIFTWGMIFNPDIYPNLETFKPAISSYSWLSNSSVYDFSTDTISVAPKHPGLVNYRFEATDEYGCHYLEEVEMTVLPKENPSCLSCSNPTQEMQDTFLLCQLDTIQVDASVLLNDLDSTVQFEYILHKNLFSGGMHENSGLFAILVNNLLPIQLTDANLQIQEVCVDITYPEVENLNISLMAPDGTEMLLSNGTGLSGNTLSQTCFSPAGNTPLSAAISPYSGLFQAEGDWTVFNGVPLNGAWSLLIDDPLTDSLSGLIGSWSVTLRKENEFTFEWSPNLSISCTDCPAPFISPLMDQSYYVNIEDSYGCIRQDSFFVSVLPLDEAPIVSCEVTDFGELTFNWDAITGMVSYEVNVNEGGWQLANQNLSHTINGLTDGEVVTIKVRGIPLNSEICKTSIATASCIYEDPCLLALNLTGQQSPGCSDSADGFITLNATGGNGAISYSLVGGNQQGSAVFSNLASGNYFFFANDQNGCTDSIEVQLPGPVPLVLTADITPNLCNGAKEGSIIVAASGGTGNKSYNWEGPGGFTDTQSNLSGLFSGNYCLTVTDGNNCKLDTCLELTQPEAIQSAITTTPATCADSNDGVATISALGGTGLLSFFWSTGQSGGTANQLVSGQYFVTTTDANGCNLVDTVFINSPMPITIEEIVIDDVLCHGDSTGSAELTLTGGTPPFQYDWDDLDAQTTNPAVGLTAGVYNFNITDANGCTLSGNTIIEQPEPLQIDLDITDILCAGDSTGAAAVQVSGGVTPYNFTWIPGLFSGSQANNLSAGEYSVFVTDNNGCSSKNDFSIIQPAAPLSLNLEQIYTACAGAGDGEAEAIVTGGTGAYHFLWSNNQNEPIATDLLPQIYSVTVTDVAGCQVENAILIEELMPITVDLSAEMPKCVGQKNGKAQVITVSGGAGSGNINEYFYSWNTIPVQTGPLAQGLAGNTSYSVIITDNQGCTASSSIFINEPEPIEVSVTTENALCYGSSDGYGVVLPDGPNPGYSYQWSVNITDFQDSLAYNLAAGTYAVTVTDNLGCSNSTVFSINQPSPIFVSLNATGNSCFDSAEGTLTASPTGGDPAYTLSWSTGQTGEVIENLPGGTYTVTVSDASGCTIEETGFVPAPPPISATVSSTGVTCFGDTDGRLIIDPSGGIPPYQYSLDGGPFNGLSTIVGLAPGSYSIEIMDNKGCTWATAGDVANAFNLVVDAGEDIEIESGDSVQLDFFVGGFVGSYQNIWIQPYSGTLSCPDCIACDSLIVYCTNPFASPTLTTSYEVVVEDQKGCKASDKITIRINKERSVYVPTGFSPNGDSNNESLYVRGRPGTRILTFQVFDRWGEMMYRIDEADINDPSTGWDGTFRGKDVQNNLVVWYVEVEYIDGEKEIKRGQTYLFR